MLFLKIIGIALIVLAVAVGIIYLLSTNYRTYPIHFDSTNAPSLNTNDDYKTTAIELVSQMTIEEKIDQMYGEKMWYSGPKMAIGFFITKRFPHVYVGRNERLGIPPWVLSDGPRGARVMDKSVKGVTVFPVAMARGASWDPDLEFRVNEVIATEMRANKVNYAATPCINLLRHPGWGRAQETYGEDPWLLGEFGVAAVKGIEKHNVMACPKHFALNSVENSRWVVNVELDERTLREVYLPHFKKTIQKGKPASIMSAYNKVRGQYCAENSYLLTTILKQEWGFDGFVTSDWVSGTYDGVASVQAGLEVEMPWQQAYNYKDLKTGIDAGKINETQIDNLVTRSLATRLKYANVQDQSNYPTDLVASNPHTQLALEAAEKSMVLIKNDDVLPFEQNSGKRVAVIGRLANLANTGDHGSSDAVPAYVITPFEGIQKFHADLGNEVILDNASNLEKSKELAASVDEVIVVVGYTYKSEGEYIVINREGMEKSAKAGKLVGKRGTGGDREDLRLIPEDEALIEALHPINKKLVVVYVGGSAIDMSSWDSDVPAILYSWYSGMEGGNALAKILYGEVSPQGKLPFSIPENITDYPYFNPYTNNIEYGYYHGYTLFDKEGIRVKYPFGFGLSYTSFKISDVSVEEQNIRPSDTLEVKLKLTNTGDVRGAEVIQLYIGFGQSSVDRPVKLLRDFKTVTLNPGETSAITLKVAVEDLKWYNPEIKSWELEFMEYEYYIGNSSQNEQLISGTFSLSP